MTLVVTDPLQKLLQDRQRTAIFSRLRHQMALDHGYSLLLVGRCICWADGAPAALSWGTQQLDLPFLRQSLRASNRQNAPTYEVGRPAGSSVKPIRQFCGI